MLTELWKHQHIGREKLVTNNEYALFWEMGTGKTRAVIESLRMIYARDGKLLPTLIFAPPVVCGNWSREITMYSKIGYKSVHNIGVQSGKKRLELLENLGNHIVIANYESLRNKEVYNKLAAWKPQIVILDESHRCKNPKALQAKLVYNIAKTANRRYLLTGSPILNSPADVFQQFKILDGGITFGANFYAFRARYFEDENAKFAGKPHYFPKWVPKPTCFVMLQSAMRSKAMIIKKTECLDLPPLVKVNYTVQLSKEQLKAYVEMRSDFITFIKREHKEPAAVVAQMAMTKALRLQQIVTGFANTSEGEVEFATNPRLEALSQILDDVLPNKIIIWAYFKQNLRAIEGLLREKKISFVSLHGDTSKSDRDKAIESFQGDPSVKVFVGNQASGGIGITLTQASHMVYYSKGFALEHDVQSEARNHRGGSEIHEKITRVDLVAEGTIDQLVNEALGTKKQISETILSWKEHDL